MRRLASLTVVKGVLAGILPGVRVGLFVGFTETTSTHVRVDLGCCQTLVSQQFLDTAEIGSTVEQMRRETMTQCVWRGLLRKAGRLDVFLQHATDAAGRESPAEAIQKNRGSLCRRSLRIRLANFHPLVECFGCEATHRGDPFLATLSEYSENAGSSIPVINV